MGIAYLLDTHAFVWAVTNPSRLGSDSAARIEDAKCELLVSAATAWELAIKVRLGKFPEAEPLVAQYDRLVQRLGATHLPIGNDHALRAGGLAWSHRDPFDRVLAAQAMLEQYCLITRDREFASLGGLEIVW